MAKLDDTTINALAGIATQLGTVLGNSQIGPVANAAAALAKLLDGNGPVAADIAATLRAAVETYEAKVFAALDRAAGDGDDGA